MCGCMTGWLRGTHTVNSAISILLEPMQQTPTEWGQFCQGSVSSGGWTGAASSCQCSFVSRSSPGTLAPIIVSRGCSLPAHPVRCALPERLTQPLTHIHTHSDGAVGADPHTPFPPAQKTHTGRHTHNTRTHTHVGIGVDCAGLHVTFSLSLSHTHTHTHTRVHTDIDARTQTHTRTRTLITHTHAHAFSLYLSLCYSFSPSLSLCFLSFFFPSPHAVVRQAPPKMRPRNVANRSCPATWKATVPKHNGNTPSKTDAGGVKSAACAW